MFTVLTLLFSFSSCKKFLDIVPDDVATIETAFNLRITAERYLFTCYSWMPPVMNMADDPAAGYWGGELWGITPANENQAFMYAKGDQGIVEPRLNYWVGEKGGITLFRGLRDCNIFLENINKVFDITEEERARWIGEVKFLKAFYTYYLVQLYGPIPLMRENIPISASAEEVKGYRDPVDDCFAYIVQLLNEAIPDLPPTIVNLEGEAGRITSVIAAAVKAKVLVTAASPLYNGNTELATLKDKRGIALFNPSYEVNKWVIAKNAAKEAIDLSHSAGARLYKFVPGFGQITSEATAYQMSVRNSIASRWNEEVIWSDPNNLPDQRALTPIAWDIANYPTGFTAISGKYGSSIEFTELFYTKNGLPIEEDKSWDYDGRYGLKTAGLNDRYNVAQGYTTVKMVFDRENRFYADLGFDGGIWYGQGKYDDNATWVLKTKLGDNAGYGSVTNHTPTGYFPKKRIHYQNVMSNPTTYSVNWYPAPRIRLADLYLLYAEAVNEASGPTAEVYEYLNLIRERVGLPTIQSAWTNFSKNPAKYQNKDGLREIIHREREIELAFESQRFWDMKRWKRAVVEFSKPISGWNLRQATAANYFQKQLVFQPSFTARNYFEPLKEASILNNPNLVQNPGW